MSEKISRREFMKSTIGAALATGGLSHLSLEKALMASPQELAASLPNATLGRTKIEVKRVGLGTLFYSSKSYSNEESVELINTALDLGINFIDTARIYADAEERLIGLVMASRRKECFLSTKTLKRTKEEAKKDVEISLKNLKTDYIDIYHLHDVSSLYEYDMVTSQGGALEGLKEAKNEGKIGFIGITGHSVHVHMTAIKSGEFDACLLVYNPVGRDTEKVVSLAEKNNVGIIVMKPLASGGTILRDRFGQVEDILSIEDCLRFVLSNPGVSVAIPGSSNTGFLKYNVAVGASFKPLSDSEKEGLIAKADKIASGKCGNCSKPCEPLCPVNIPIGTILSLLQYQYRFWYDFRRLGDEYTALSNNFLSCIGCGECEKVCPEKFNLQERLSEAHNSLNERRARSMTLK